MNVEIKALSRIAQRFLQALNALQRVRTAVHASSLNLIAKHLADNQDCARFPSESFEVSHIVLQPLRVRQEFAIVSHKD